MARRGGLPAEFRTGAGLDGLVCAGRAYRPGACDRRVPRAPKGRGKVPDRAARAAQPVPHAAADGHVHDDQPVDPGPADHPGGLGRGTVKALTWTWPFDSTVYAGLAAAFLVHAWLARDAPDAERKHTLYLIAGLATLWVALETPIDVISDRYLDSVHMLHHFLLGFVDPPLLLLSLSRAMVRRLVTIPGVQLITEPIPAQVIAGTARTGWHLPPLYNAT